MIGRADPSSFSGILVVVVVVVVVVDVVVFVDLVSSLKCN